MYSTNLHSQNDRSLPLCLCANINEGAILNLGIAEWRDGDNIDIVDVDMLRMRIVYWC
jgi:hypothetical protein